METVSHTHNRERFLLTILLLVLGFALTVSNGLKRWDLTLYDLFSTVSYQNPSDEVLIIAIDELSLREYGRWPWPRRAPVFFLAPTRQFLLASTQPRPRLRWRQFFF